MRTASFRYFFLLLIGFSIIFSNGTPVSAALVTDIRFWTAPDHTRVVLDLTDSVQYKGSPIENPPQYHLELKDATLLTKKREVDVNDPYLSKIILSPLGKKKVKLILHQKKSLNVSIFPLKPYQDKPHRLVINLVDASLEKKEIEDRRKQKEIRTKGTKIVVIDPGHGGEDPGAIGPKKTMEKDIVLKVGTKLVHLLNQDNEIQAFLTRKGDYFIPLGDRSKMATDYDADLFISLHTDASFNPDTRGSSVYCLSLSGATDEAARILANKENLSNFLGGVISKPITNRKDEIEPILVDLAQSDTMRESFRFAETVLEDLKAVNLLKYSSYRQANFIVLRAAKIPSVLIEMAYITNKEDERLLNRNDFQGNMAKIISSSIKRYFK